MNSPAIKKLLKTLLTLFVIGLVFFIPWCYFFAPKSVSQHWQEEILLSNCSVIWITRTAKFKLNNIGPLSKFTDAASRGTMTNMVLTIEIPKNSIANSPPKWSFNAVPILLDYDVEKKHG